MVMLVSLCPDLLCEENLAVSIPLLKSDLSSSLAGLVQSSSTWCSRFPLSSCDCCSWVPVLTPTRFALLRLRNPGVHLSIPHHLVFISQSCTFDTPAMATHEHRSTLPTKDRITPNTSPRRPSEPTHSTIGKSGQERARG